MEEVSRDPAKSAGWPKPADLSGMLIGRNLMCRKTEVSVGNLVSPAAFKNCEYLLQLGRKFYLCRHCAPHGFAASLHWVVCSKAVKPKKTPKKTEDSSTCCKQKSNLYWVEDTTWSRRLGREKAQNTMKKGRGLRLGGKGWHAPVYKLGWMLEELSREWRRGSCDIWARCTTILSQILKQPGLGLWDLETLYPSELNICP